jgi:hypothetical protein
MYYKFRRSIKFNGDAVDVKTILEQAKLVFKEFEFDKVEIKNNSVRFDNNTWYFSAPGEYKKYVSKGNLTVIKDERQISVTYESNTFIWGFIFLLIFSCIFGFLLKTSLFFLVPFIGLISGYFIVRDGGINLMDRLKEKIEYDK